MNRNGPVALGFHAAFTVFLIAPLAIVCLVAFTPGNLLSVPTIHFSMRWFKAIVDDPDFTQAFANSLWLATLSATLAAMLAVPAALGLIRYRFPGRDAINSLLLSPLMIPPVVLGVALLQLFTRVGVSGSFVSLVMAHVMLVFPVLPAADHGVAGRDDARCRARCRFARGKRMGHFSAHHACPR